MGRVLEPPPFEVRGFHPSKFGALPCEPTFLNPQTETTLMKETSFSHGSDCRFCPQNTVLGTVTPQVSNTSRIGLTRTKLWPKLIAPNLAEVEVGRSRVSPKSKLAEVELAEILDGEGIVCGCGGSQQYIVKLCAEKAAIEVEHTLGNSGCGVVVCTVAGRCRDKIMAVTGAVDKEDILQSALQRSVLHDTTTNAKFDTL